VDARGTTLGPSVGRSWPLRATAAGLVGLLAIGGVALWLAAERTAASSGRQDQAKLARSAFQDATGVRVIRVAIVGGGGLVDLRYQVIDPDRAQVVHLTPPVLVEEETGEVIDTLFMGHAHGADPKAGYTYPLIFVNEGGLLEPGSAVSVVIGEARLEHVTAR